MVRSVDERVARKVAAVRAKEERAKNRPEFRSLYEEADLAGKAAAEACVPEPMIVVERANPLDDSSPIVRQWAPVMGGVCGFAWVNIRPGTSSFARWLKKVGLARSDSYYGGVTVWVGDYGQSMERKMAYASAFASVLSDAGITARAMSRMD